MVSLENDISESVLVVEIVLRDRKKYMTTFKLHSSFSLILFNKAYLCYVLFIGIK